MSFGSNFKKIRKDAKLTQEQVAAMLNVSAQAVSRWETDSAMPDISMLPAIANTFHVTTDSLLGVDVENVDAYIDKLCSDVIDFSDCDIYDKVDEFREAVRNNPNNTKLKEHYVMLLYMLHMKAERADDQELTKEICSLCSDLVASEPEVALSDYYFTMMTILQSKLPGNTPEEIVKKAKELPHMDQCQEVILPHCLKGQDRIKANKQLLFDCMRFGVTALLDLCLDGEQLDNADAVFEAALHFPEAVYGKESSIWFTDYEAYLPYFRYLHRTNQSTKATAQFLKVICLMEQCMATEELHLSERLPEDNIIVQVFSKVEYGKELVSSAAGKLLSYVKATYEKGNEFEEVISRLEAIAQETGL